MVSRQSAFLVLLIVSSIYAFLRGGRAERIGASALLAGAFLSVAMLRRTQHHFLQTEYGVLVVDLLILGVFLWLSVRRSRTWPLAMSSLISAEIVLHVDRLLAWPKPLPLIYLDMIDLWSWPMQGLMIVATWRYHRRGIKRNAAA